MIDRKHDLSITKQAKALNITRGSVYYLPRATGWAASTRSLLRSAEWGWARGRLG